MSGILAAIACGFLGMAVGAALAKWGQSQLRHGYQGEDDYEGSMFV